MASAQSGDLIAWDYVAIAVYFALNLLVGAYGCDMKEKLLKSTKSSEEQVCNSPRSPTGHPASLPHYGARSELIDLSSSRTESTTHSTYRESEATTPRVTSRTYLLLGVQGLHFKRRANNCTTRRENACYKTSGKP
ncbi:hypothetical protein E2C01_026678 [Portunus trituberculatus]|uniref:Uncharacterized protein n=1 Tax=Portunus trituberculatus TaxID=210409 RepID=A0A5B7EJV1_PORTR|nr:hypothetical protein [Portunus trituberculatus]